MWIEVFTEKLKEKVSKYSPEEQVELLKLQALLFKQFDERVERKRKREDEKLSSMVKTVFSPNDGQQQQQSSSEETEEDEDDDASPLKKPRASRAELRAWWRAQAPPNATFDLARDGYKVTKIVRVTDEGIVCVVGFPARSAKERRQVTIPWDYEQPRSLEGYFIRQFQKHYATSTNHWYRKFREHVHACAQEFEPQSRRLARFIDDQ